MLFILDHYLESTGDDFALIPDRDARPGGSGADVVPLCSLVIESSSLHCLVLRAGATVAILEVEYAPESWWTSLRRNGVALGDIDPCEPTVELVAGRYRLGDLNALCAEPSTVSSVDAPARSVRIELSQPMVASPVELDLDSETRVVGYVLEPHGS